MQNLHGVTLLAGRLHMRCIAGADTWLSLFTWNSSQHPAPTHLSILLRVMRHHVSALSTRGSTAPRQKNATHRGNVNVARHILLCRCQIEVERDNYQVARRPSAGLRDPSNKRRRVWHWSGEWGASFKWVAYKMRSVSHQKHYFGDAWNAKLKSSICACEIWIDDVVLEKLANLIK
jgi:hypothetical protein